MSTTLRVLVPVDGSEASHRAVDHVLDLSSRGLAVEVHVVNVQVPVRGVAASLVSAGELESYHRDEGMKALAEPIRRVEAAGLRCHEHIGVGSPGETVVAFVKKLACQQVVMGTHGRGGMAEILLGSVAQHVVSHAGVPVTLLR